ncbi:MAG TPA: NAD-dependent epimerase/dehydratase family protein [Solirubrobacteraceae bacterium]|jgi:nucleoside-diphosphate-sugar epimerase|nr:NAD-dependent epimerase/dehydratase family protein [Solirubrobacteraceae bacterium]
MRVVVVGATGNVGTSVVRSLAADSAVDEILAIARRAPQRPLERARFVAADIRTSDLAPLFRGADAVIHLAWLIQPGRDESVTRAVNVDGSRRVFEAVASSGAPSLVYASSVGAYSPGPKDRLVDESWPTGGIPTSFYSRHKAQVEHDLDRFEQEHPDVRVVRLRPGLIFKREAATEIRRLFIGPLLPGAILRSGLAPISPAVPGLRFQAVHSDDVGDAYRAAVLSGRSGAFNIAAEPVIGATELAEMLDARPVPVAPRIMRAAAAVTFALHLQPAEPGWVDMALGVPLMSTDRARRELGWRPRTSATGAIRELVAGLREGAGGDTWPLARSTSGRLRIREFLTGLGQRQ